MEQETHVIFGAGPVGRAVMRALLARGCRVRIACRSGVSDAPAGVTSLSGDATGVAFTREACAGAAAVYNCLNAPYDKWPEMFLPLQAGVMEGAAAAGAKLIVMENLYMYGPTGGRPLTEGLPFNATTRKGVARARMAEALLQAHRDGKVRVSAGRASDFFGPGVLESSMGERVFPAAIAGKSVQMIGDPSLPHSYTYMRDIGRGLVTLGERDEALGRAWHLPTALAVSGERFVEMIGEAAGTTPKVSRVPKILLRGLGLVNPMIREVAEMLYEFEEPFIVDDSAFCAAFGGEATPLAESIPETVAWYRSR
jgi:nucleoside-diphosphate-sugar epimerase